MSTEQQKHQIGGNPNVHQLVNGETNCHLSIEWNIIQPRKGMEYGLWMIIIVFINGNVYILGMLTVGEVMHDGGRGCMGNPCTFYSVLL